MPPSLFSAPEQRVVKTVEATVARVVRQLHCEPGQRLLVALSGGPDSVAVVHALHRIRERHGFQLVAAHLNHCLRGTESERDELFVRDLCRRLAVELIVERASGLRPPNLEERARQIRYDFLNRAAHAFNARFIVLGHHQNDQAETFLLRLLRGTGITGLAAMSELGPGSLIRPLLSLDRDIIRAYLKAIGADYVIDSSNSDERPLRNRVRAILLPQLVRDYSPKLQSHLVDLAAEMKELNQFVRTEAGRALERLLVGCSQPGTRTSLRISIAELGAMNPAFARAIMRELIARGIGDLRGIQRSHIKAMSKIATGSKPRAMVVLPRGWRFRRDYDSAVLERADSAEASEPSADQSELTLKSGENALRWCGCSLTLSELNINEPDFSAAPWHRASLLEAYFDAEVVCVLAVRRWRAGDRIRPLGLGGSRKIQDVFVDKKIPRARRSQWPLVVCQEEVVWIPGVVRSAVGLVSRTSRKVLHLRADPLPDAPSV